MAKPTTRAQFKDYCLRKLGHPVIQINLDDDQIEDRIDDALSFFHDYHFDGCEKIYMKHQFTQADIDRRWIYCPDPVIFVTGVLPFDDSNSSINMFDLRYQLRLHDLYDFTSVSYVSYEITMQHIRTLNLLFSGTPQFRFNRHHNKVHLDINWESDAQVGKYVIIECYRKMNPDTVTLTGTITGNTSSNTLTGTATTFDQEVIENDFITLSDGQEVQIRKLNSPTEIVIATSLTANVSNVSMTKPGISDVWNDRFLKKYATALIKRQWGNNMKKFSGIQMPGGVTLNGKEIYDEAAEEIEKIEEDMFNFNSLPSEIFTG
jgi:sporulation protein YlmC with PRC-barrel domain